MLAPIILTDEQLQQWENANLNVVEQPSRTYKIDFVTGNITSTFIDGADAVIQSAIKIIKTIRYNYLIYSTDYGAEVDKVIGQNYSLDYLNLEVPRIIQDALSVDSRIIEAFNFKITREGEALIIKFDMTSIVTDEILTLEVDVYV